MGRAKTSLQNLGQKVNGVRPEGKFIADVLQDMADDYLSGRNASLQPSGTDTSTNILAFTEDKGIWIATDNGHWYYWNGTQYVDGGVYQATEIVDGEVTFPKLVDYLQNRFTSLELSANNIKWIDNSFVNQAGTITSDNARCRTDYMLVIPNTTLTFAGETNNQYVNAIQFYNASKSKITGYSQIGTNYTSVSVSVPENAKYCIISTTKAYVNKTFIKQAYSVWEYYVNYFIKENINIDINKLDKIHSSNLFNKNTILANKFISYDGYVGNANGYYASDYIPVAENTQYIANNYGNIDGAYYGFYDYNKKVISVIDKSTISSASGIFTTPTNTRYLRTSTKAPSTQIVALGNTLPTYEAYTDYLPLDLLEDRVEDLEEVVGTKIVNIYTTDTEEEIYLKLANAKTVGNCDVYWEYGTYTFDTIFDKLKNDYGFNTAYELPIGNGCKYFFNNSTIIGQYSGSDSNVRTNASVFGTRRSTSGDFELHNGTIKAIGIIYCVHDEGTGGTNPYCHKYSDLTLEYDKDTTDYNISKCIGGGAGLHGKIIIERCILKSNNSYEVSWHGYEANSGAKLEINITNCYLEHGFSRDQFYTGEQAILLFSANSYVNFGGTTTNWTTYSFSNTTRT